MSIFDQIRERARSTCPRIVLPEGDDPRIVEGARRAEQEGIAKPILLKGGGGIPSAYTQAYFELRKHKGVDLEAAEAAMSDRLARAAMMVRLGDAEGTVAGAVATTADTVRHALQIIGRAPGAKLVSSFFLIVPRNAKPTLVFADCGLVIDPDAGEMAEIAIAASDSFRKLAGEEPKTAMLSFSTYGSAKHERVDKVQEATRIAKAARPDLTIDGELQFDAAFVPGVARSKAKGSPLEGNANVFIFPSLEAANIGYKIAQRIGGAQAIGPVLQGLAKPANDLSRGCSADDVYHLIAVTAAQASG